MEGLWGAKGGGGGGRVHVCVYVCVLLECVRSVSVLSVVSVSV